MKSKCIKVKETINREVLKVCVLMKASELLQFSSSILNYFIIMDSKIAVIFW